MLVYLDACTLIYLVEGTDDLTDAVLARLSDPAVRLVTSRLSRLECRVAPLRASDGELLDRYEQVFAASDLTIAEITGDVLEVATSIRAQHGVRTPDAIHLATALEVGADFVLTGDADLRRVRVPRVEVIEFPDA